MNKRYVLLPLVLLGAFIFLERGAAQTRVQRDQIAQAHHAAAKDAADRERIMQTKKAADEARARAEEQAQKERAQAEKKQRSLEEALAKLTHEADQEVANVAQLEHEISSLETRLAAARQRRAETEQAVFTQARDIEAQRVARRNAELEVQRAARALAARFESARDGGQK